MPYMQQPNTVGAVNGANQYGQSSRSSSFAEVSASTLYAKAPLEAFRDIPPRQDPCIVKHTSDFIDTLARARIIAVMAMNIFVYDRPLNARRDRWICPFSNCKESFLDPKAMMSHAAYCTHVSANGAYCNCCGCYYDFPGQSPACLTKAGDSAPPIAKDSAMTKGKRKFHEFLNRRSGSSSSFKASSSFDAEFGMDSLFASRKSSVVSDYSTTASPSGHQPSQGTAELCADYQVVEIGNSKILPNRSNVSSRTDFDHVPKALTSTMSTTDYVEPMFSDHRDLCMSPTEYSPPSNRCSTQRLNNDNAPYADMNRSVNTTQQSEDQDQVARWDSDVRQAAAEGFNFGTFSMPPQESHGLMVHVPNFSRPRFPEQSGQSRETPLSDSRSLNQWEDITPVAMSHSQHHYEDVVEFSHFTSTDQNLVEVGIAYGNVQHFDITGVPLTDASSPAGTLPGSSGFNQDGNAEMRCPDCGFQPQGKLENRKAYLKKHRRRHGKRIPLICHQCGRACTRSDNLVAHLRGACERKQARQHGNYHTRP